MNDSRLRVSVVARNDRTGFFFNPFGLIILENLSYKYSKYNWCIAIKMVNVFDAWFIDVAVTDKRKTCTRMKRTKFKYGE